MAKLKYNVGSMAGQNGVGVIYLGATDAGAEFLFVLHDHDANAGTAPKPLFLSKSSIANLIESASPNCMIARVVNFAGLMESPVTGLLDADGFITISNAPTTFPRLFDGSIALFSVKGTDVAASSIPTNTTIVTSTTVADWKAGKALTAGEDKDGDGVPDAPTVTSKGALQAAQDFVTQNPALSLLILALVILLIYWLVSMNSKKKGKRKKR